MIRLQETYEAKLRFNLATPGSAVRHATDGLQSLVSQARRININPCPAEPGYTLHLQTV